MIAKQSKRNADAQSSFAKLAAYILDAKNGGKKLAHVDFANCLAPDVDIAIMEIEACQVQNQRTKVDKTYHLILSFHPDDNLTREQLRAIEAEVCEAIGFEEHQRLSALHTDTEHPHLHIAINKIHPKTKRAISPYGDHLKLRDACLAIERKFGLRPDGDRLEQSSGYARGKAGDRERRSGIETFHGWVRREAGPVLRECLGNSSATWADVHRALAGLDLELRPRGAGLVVSDRNRKLFVRASALGREFGKKGLEERLGPYDSPGSEIASIEAQKRFEVGGIHRHPERQVLWRQYQAQRGEIRTAKRDELLGLKTERERRFEELKDFFAARRLEIKLDTLLGRMAKRRLYGNLKLERQKAFDGLRGELAQKRREVHERYQLVSWQDYLVDKALRGDPLALAVLRGNPLSKPPNQDSNGLRAGEGEGRGSEGIARVEGLEPKVQGNGDVAYEISRGVTVYDEGPRLRLGAFDAKALLVSLRLAQVKWGSVLEVQGSSEFKQQVAKVAAAHGLGVVFTDTQLDARRRELQDRFGPSL